MPEQGQPNDDAVPPDDELERALRSLQGLIIRYPFAAQALYAALAREGRAFADTEQGREWQARLRDSELIQRGRAVWEAVTFDLLEEDEAAVLPSKVLEAFVDATATDRLEETLSKLLSGDAFGFAKEAETRK